MYNNIKDISHYLNKYYLNNTSHYPPYVNYKILVNLVYSCIIYKSNGRK